MKDVFTVIEGIQLLGEYNVTFMHIPKCGGTSIRNWLYQAKGRSNVIKLEPNQCLTDLKDIHYIEWAFTVVRNPWDRMVSMYTYGVSHNYKFNEWLCGPNIDKEGVFPSFEEFLHLVKNQPETSELIFKHNMCEFVDGVDYVIKFENLDNDFKLVQNKFQSDLVLPKLNASNRSEYKDYYNSQTKSIVYDLYKKDIDRWEYTF